MPGAVAGKSEPCQDRGGLRSVFLRQTSEVPGLCRVGFLEVGKVTQTGTHASSCIYRVLFDVFCAHIDPGGMGMDLEEKQPKKIKNRIGPSWESECVDQSCALLKFEHAPLDASPPREPLKYRFLDMA